MQYYQVQLTTDQALMLRKNSKGSFRYRVPFFWIRLDFLGANAVIISWAMIMGSATEQKIYLCGGDGAATLWRQICKKDQLSELVPIDYDENQDEIFRGGNK